MFERWVSARAGNGSPVYWYSEGTVTEYPSGKVLARMEGFDTARLWRPDPKKPEAFQLSRKIYVFRDADTGELLREYRHRPVQSVRFPYQFITYRLEGNQLVTWLEQGAGATRLNLGPSRGITARRLGQAVSFNAPLYLDVPSPIGERRTLFENYDFFIQPKRNNPREQYQLSWLRYADRDYFTDQPTVSHMISWRVDRFEDLPASIRQYVESEAPLWRAPPRDLDEIRRLQADP
ncbi:MAG: hypothetical protein NZM12_09125 [Steroidobacteraceae bacterium]|nr:hypothetical protein [Steroidobacteraceae bacterium]MDW8258873.1 hypothetical protein [Gammaproteobacteria bacterium]